MNDAAFVRLIEKLKDQVDEQTSDQRDELWSALIAHLYVTDTAWMN